MSDENKDKKPDEKKPRFNQAQYDMLIRCSKKKDITEWNTWRDQNPNEEILLEGADLGEAHLKRSDLSRAHLKNAVLCFAHLEGSYLDEAHLEGADLNEAHLEGALLFQAHLGNAELNATHLESADLIETHLEDATLFGVHLEGANLRDAYLEGAKLIEAHIKGANFRRAHLKGANLRSAHLENTDLEKACLEGANFLEANLKGTIFKYADLKGTCFRRAVVDGSTSVWQCKVSRHTNENEKCTDFSGVSINQIRINPETKQLLEYNIRRMNWLVWYKGKSDNKYIRWIRILLTSPVRLFWSMSDYGRSTGRIIFTFFVLAIAFAVVYVCFDGLVGFNCKADIEEFQSFWHAVYFSVVTMTTLGFGDIAANPYSWWGQTLLMLQVLLGYVLLAALVTRFAVLFTAGGPAGRFSGDKSLRQKLFGDRTFTEWFFGEQPKNPTNKRTKKPKDEKKHIRRSWAKRARLVLFFIGIGIAICAWFLDKATRFRCILRFVAPDYVVVQDVLEILDKGEKEVVSIDHPGAQVLLRLLEPHPPAQVLGRLSGIGRSTGVLDLPNAKQFYEVRLLADNNTKMLGSEFVWKDIDIRACMEKSLDDSTFSWSAPFFFLGIFLSVGMTLWEHFDK